MMVIYEKAVWYTWLRDWNWYIDVSEKRDLDNH